MIKLQDILETINIKKLLQQTEIEAKDLYDDDRWDKLTPEMCNDGYCDIFADKFKEMYPASEKWTTDYGIDDSFGHVFNKLGNKFYDAETPQGVTDWKQLPYMQKVLKLYKKYPDDVAKM